MHDYLYFSEPWDYNGTHYDAGYYDENGTRYDSVVMKTENGDNTVTITCQYCGSTTKIDWKEGDLPACTHCGAPLDLSGIQSDTISSSGQYGEESRQTVSDSSGSSAGTGKKKTLRTIVLFLTAAVLGLGLRSVIKADTSPEIKDSGNTETVYMTPVESDDQQFGPMLYLAEIVDGTYDLSTEESSTKVLVWDEELECYYDNTTGAYLWYNTHEEPAVWQYWYEGISNPYESGWMEYDGGSWYIETAEGEWEKYTGSTAGLWHIGYISDEKMYGDMLYLAVTESGNYEVSSRESYTRSLPWDVDSNCYYDSATGAYLWYNIYEEPAVWQYWYEGISNPYESGWMEYSGGKWYIETSKDKWEEYTGSTAGLWHIETQPES